MGDLFNTDSWFTGWGDTTPVAPDNTDSTNTDTFNTDSSNYDYSNNSQVYPDGYGGYTDINGNQVDSTGQPISYDSNGNQIDSNGNIINQASPYDYTSQDQTIAPGGYDANGNPLDANGNPMSPQQQQQYQTRQQYNQQQGQQRQQQGGGSMLGNLVGGGGSSLLGTLGGLALVGGAGYLLSQLLSHKSSGGAGTVNPVNIPQGNLQYNQLASPGTNPGYSMGQPVAPAQPVPSSLTSAPNVSAIPTLNPTNLSIATHILGAQPGSLGAMQ